MDFAADKPAGSPCRNLAPDSSCTIHEKLRACGFRGCTVFDCFGAGQAVSQRLFDGVSWRERPESKQEMFSAFSIMRQLHEMLWYLYEAQARTYDPDSAQQARDFASTIATLAGGSATELFCADLDALHSDVRAILMDISEEVRACYFADGERLDSSLAPGSDLAGRNLREHRLRGADLRGACLIAADLRYLDLAGTDLLGADLRDARLEGADLSAALHVTQPQINAARGSVGTLLPDGVATPSHWHG